MAVINIQVVINTNIIMLEYPYPSRDSANPTGLSDHYIGMMSTKDNKVVSSAKSLLNISANVGDIIRWHVVSESGNFENAAAFYKMNKYIGDTIFQPPVFLYGELPSIMPKDGTAAGINFTSQRFWFHQAAVVAKGLETYTVQFAVYTRQKSSAEPVLYGYYYCETSLQIS